MKAPRVIIYGPPKIGKTVLAIQAVGRAAAWLSCDAGAIAPATVAVLNPWRTHCKLRGDVIGIDTGHAHVSGCGELVIPKQIECIDPDKPFEEMLRAVVAMEKAVHAGKIGAVVIDTFSAFSDREWRRITMDDGIKEGYAKANRALANSVKRIIDRIVAMQILMVGLCHEREPTEFEGKKTPGGPLFAGDLVKSVPGMVDSVLRCDTDWVDGQAVRVLKCDPTNRTRLSGDRWHVVNGTVPFDLYPILRQMCAQAKLLE